MCIKGNFTPPYRFLLTIFVGQILGVHFLLIIALKENLNELRRPTATSAERELQRFRKGQ